jgi:predicted RNA-binding Zn ribbon-like protein
MRSVTNLLPAPPDDLCLAYANTRFWRGTAAPTETLAGLPDLAKWIAASTGTKVSASPASVRDPDAFAAAIAVREAIFRIFTRVAHGRPVADADLAALNRALAGAPARARLVRGRHGHAWACANPASFEALLAPVLWSAADLLAGGGAVRACANDECRWLFVDRSRAGRRRWCMMSACGNRHKARRHYLKSKKEGATAPSPRSRDRSRARP